MERSGRFRARLSERNYDRDYTILTDWLRAQ
jgi:hypothetical protein